MLRCTPQQQMVIVIIVVSWISQVTAALCNVQYVVYNMMQLQVLADIFTTCCISIKMVQLC